MSGSGNNYEQQLPADGHSGSPKGELFCFVSPDGTHRIEGEGAGYARFGDFRYKLTIDGRPFRGYAWDRGFAFSPDSRYFVFDWSGGSTNSLVVAVDLQKQQFCRLPISLRNQSFSINYPHVIVHGTVESTDWYTFTGEETWLTY